MALGPDGLRAFLTYGKIILLQIIIIKEKI